MKFTFKGKGKTALEAVKPIAFGTLGVIGAQKFLDFKTLFPNASPDKFFMKHEGMIKVGAVVLTLMMWQKIPPLLKWVLIGVAIQGGIKATKQYTMNAATGKSFIDSIGAGTYEDQMNKLAEQVKTEAEKKSQTNVGGPKSETSVGEVTGMGWNMTEPGYRHAA